jgi:prepilin-type N-terminal cleavage/methylation domain-containing protein
MNFQMTGGDRRCSASRAAFTLPEILVVVGVIAVLIVILLPALAGAWRTGSMAKSQNNLKQIAFWMTQYSTENRDHILPSQFDYRDPTNPSQAINGYPVKVRSHPSLGNLRYQGTWSDILWTTYGLGSTFKLHDASNPSDIDKYLFDSPDKAAYETSGVFDDNPLRAAAPNSRDFKVGNGFGNGPKPFGTGAVESGLAGYFAANNYFNASPSAPPLPPTTPGGPSSPTPATGRWYTNGQIKAPERSMYLIDSFAGETIEPLAEPYNVDPAVGTCEVDFRYNGACLMLFLDGHSDPQTRWLDLADLQSNRRIKIQNLDRNR